MLFNSYVFIFIFLPTALIGFFQLGRLGQSRIAIGWLVGASLFFYGWWNPKYLLLLVGSISINYMLGTALANQKASFSPATRKFILFFGVAANVAVLVYYKYSYFFVENMNALFHSQMTLPKVILPLAISFHTFQQIAYLVDIYHRPRREYKFLDYCLFVSFFPQLIAGPITHHREMFPQFASKSIYQFRQSNFSVGITIFIIGLMKKVIIADTLSGYVAPIFSLAGNETVSFFETWGGALAYTLQIYFDFSGYSDMAIGLSRMFGVRLPTNFHSPYKAIDIIDFWRRWHMTLSRFLRDYLYIPLGGNRKGPARRYVNLMITMVLGGLWHGAGWTFIIWGTLHGCYLGLNHWWQDFCRRSGFVFLRPTRVGSIISRIVTFLSVVVGWVFFRSENLKTAVNMIKSMVGMGGFVLWDSYRAHLNKFFGLGDLLAGVGFKYSSIDFFTIKEVMLIFLLLICVWCFPNTQQFMARYKPCIYTYKGDNQPLKWRWMYWRPTILWAGVMAIIALICISGFLSKASEFLYFQF